MLSINPRILLRKTAIALSVVLAAVLIFGAGTRSHAAEGEKTLKVAGTLPLYSKRFDQNTSFYTAHDFILKLLFDKLRKFDRNGYVQPFSASSVIYADDGMSIEIKLAGNDFWSNGEPVTAHDYVRGIERSAKKDSDTAVILEGLTGAAEWKEGDYSVPLGAQAPDDATIIFSTTEPFKFDLGSLLNMGMNPYAENTADVHFGAPGHEHGNGPYMIDTLSEDHVRLIRNPHYVREIHYFDVIEFVAFEPARAIDLFISGKADLLLGPVGSQSKWLNENFLEAAIDVGMPRIYSIDLPTIKSGLDDASVRKALFSALDIEGFGAQFSALPNVEPTRFIPVKAGSHEDERAENWLVEGTMAERIERAKATLAQANISRDNPIEIDLVVASSVHGYSQIAAFIKSSWYPLGIDVNLIDIPGYWDAIDEMDKGTRDGMITSYFYIQPHMYVIAPSGGGRIGEGTELAEDDSKSKSLRLQLMLATDPDERNKLIVEAEEHMLDRLDFIPIATAPRLGYAGEDILLNQEQMPKLSLRYLTRN